MAVAAPAADFAKLLFRTPPFNRMSSARRFQLLSQARSVRFAKGEQIFSHTQPPQEVCMILSGTACVFSELSGEPEPVYMGDLGPGDCAGWVAALAGASGTRIHAKTEVQGLMVSAPAFLEIARYDPALHEEMFSKVRKSEVWRAVLAEMERRLGGVKGARDIVASLQAACRAADWPEDEEQISASRDMLWIVAGGEGVKSGDRWSSTDGVLWARLVGLPAERLTKALAGDAPRPAKESVRTRPSSLAKRSPSRVEPAGASSGTARPVSEKLAPVVPPLQPAGPRRTIWKALGLAAVIALATGAGAAFWASRQPITEPVNAAGTLNFVGERRTIMAGVNGTVSEWNLKPGTRIERGCVIAIIQPPVDEERARALGAAAAAARANAEFCEAALAGRPADSTGVDRAVADLAGELARLRSDNRVYAAVERGATTDYALNAEERQRVSAAFANARAEQRDRLDAAVQDSTPRVQELRDAEEELREAQQEMNLQLKAVADIRAQKDNESSRQDLATARRALGLTQRAVSQKQEVVNRLRKEIAAIRADTGPAPAPSDDAAKALPAIRAGIFKLEEQLQRDVDSFRADQAAREAALVQLRADAAPRQIQALQPGYVLESASLHPGSTVQTDTILGRLTTRQAWEVECRLHTEQLTRLTPGQEFTIVATSPDGTQTRVREHYEMVASTDGRPHLQMLSSRDEWHDGIPVRLEATVVTGTLLQSWLKQMRWTLHF